MLSPMDALANLVRCCLLPGHHFDTVGVTRLIANSHFGTLIADQAFDWMGHLLKG